MALALPVSVVQEVTRRLPSGLMLLRQLLVDLIREAVRELLYSYTPLALPM